MHVTNAERSPLRFYFFRRCRRRCRRGRRRRLWLEQLGGDELPVPPVRDRLRLRRQHLLRRRLGQHLLRRAVRRLPGELRLSGARRLRRRGPPDLLPAGRDLRRRDARHERRWRRLGRWRLGRRGRRWRRARGRHGLRAVHGAVGRHRQHDRRHRRPSLLRLHRRHARRGSTNGYSAALQAVINNIYTRDEDGRRPVRARRWRSHGGVERLAGLGGDVGLRDGGGAARQAGVHDDGQPRVRHVVRRAGLRLRQRLARRTSSCRRIWRSCSSSRGRRCPTTASTS